MRLLLFTLIMLTLLVQAGCANQQVLDRIDQLEGARRFWHIGFIAISAMVIGGVAGLLVASGPSTTPGPGPRGRG